jgi:hypothetical protein
MTQQAGASSHQDADPNRFRGARKTKDTQPKKAPSFSQTPKRHRVFSQYSGDA